MMKRIITLASSIRLFIFDVDGVLTDGTLFLTDENVEIKGFNSLDGLGMRALQNMGVDIAIITGRQSNLVEYRMKSLGIKHIYQGNLHKMAVYEKLLSTLNLADNQVAYMGDDWSDLPLMRRAGLSIAPHNAIKEVKQFADWVTQKTGGRGAAREACDLIIRAQGELENAYNSLWEKHD